MIAVIGGGWAGCAAAVALARSGHRVTLYETAPALGGRAREVVHAGLPLDNGEHLLVGAYTETMGLARIVGDGAEPLWSTAPLSMQPLASAQTNALTLRARRLPAPFGLLTALIAAGGLTWRERIATIAWFARQRRAGYCVADSTTVAEWLAGLPPSARGGLLEPLCLAALNTPTERASARIFANVLHATFGAGTRATDLVRPRLGLGGTIPFHTGRWLANRGHDVRTASRARVVAAKAGIEIEHAHGGAERVDAAVLAVGPHQLASAVDPGLASHHDRLAAALRAVERFAWEPITTVYLGYDGAVSLPPALTRLDDAPGQWVFDRCDIVARAIPFAGRPDIRALLSVVISAHGPHDALDHPSLVAAVDAQLRRLRPRLPGLQWSQVIEEKRATYACVPALARPTCGSVGERLYLAGDYTYDAFPATLEAAVRSGNIAARAVVRDVPP